MFNRVKIISEITRFLNPCPSLALQRTICLSAVNNLQVSPTLYAEPLKKKKRLDPAIIKAREDRKKKKIEKQIRRLEKNARQLKPIDECEIPLHVFDERDKRIRGKVELDEAESERRALLVKAWAKYKLDQYLRDIKMLDRIRMSQQKALDELKLESEELYEEAMQTDFHLVNVKTEGPVQTPPIDKYDAPDGEYVDISRKWE